MPTQNNRRHIRYSVRHTAWLQLSKAGDIPVLINNHSPGGVYVTMVDRTQPSDHPIARQLGAGDQVMLGVQLSVDKTIQQYAGRVIRATQLGFAIAFERDHERLSAQLMEIAEHQGFQNIESQVQLEPAQREKLIQKVRQRTVSFFNRYLTEAMDDLKHRLLDSASDVKDPGHQTPYFDALSIFHNHQKTIIESFQTRLDSHFDDFHHIRHDEDADGESAGQLLALVDDEEFEQWLSLSEFISAIHNRNHQTLMELETRLTELIGTTIESSNNPLDPMVVHHYLSVEFQKYAFGHRPSQLIWKTISSHVNAHISNLYKGINATLSEAGILPDIVLTPHQVSQRRQGSQSAAPSSPEEESTEAVELEQSAESAESPAVATEQAQSATAMQNELPNEPSGTELHPGAVPQNATDKIIDLLELLGNRSVGGAHEQSPAVSGDQAPIDPIELDQLNAALNDLQSADIGARRQPLRQRIDQALSERFGDDQSNQIQREHEQIIGVAEQLLEFIDNDDVLDEQSKQWIAQLDIQLLKVLLDQQPIFTDQDNPARAVVDNLGDSSFDSGDDLTTSDQRLVDQITEIVDRLKVLDSPDQTAFKESAERLNKLLTRQRRQRVIQMRRVIDMCEGQQRMSQARNQVTQALDERFTGRQIPQLIEELLDLGWHELMNLAMVRGGHEDPEWQTLISTVDKLDSQLSDETQHDSLGKESHDEIINVISDRLIGNNLSPKRCNRLIEDINDALINPDEEITQVAYQPLQAEKAEPEASELTQEQNYWLGVAKSIEADMWLLYPDSAGQSRPIRLAWISEDKNQYVFVNRNGRKVLERSLTELAEDFQNKQASLIDGQDSSLVDRSWHGMVNQLHDQIAHQATHDELTGTLNRKEFSRQLRLKLGESKLMHSVHSTILVNLDHFRVINNISGEETGDQLLQDVSRTIDKHLPEQAILSRLNADEFAVLLPSTDLIHGEEIAESIRIDIANIHNRKKNTNLQVTASIGLVQVDRNSESVGSVLNQLETSLKTAKQNGRDQVVTHAVGKDDSERIDQTESWVMEIDQVLEQNRIELYAQQIASINDEDELRHQYEILCRMKTSDGGTIPPEKFISAAEAYGRIHFLDEWVIARSLQMLDSSPNRDLISRLAINISGKTFNRPGFVPYIKQQFEKVSVPPSRICFEITETAAISNLSQCSDFLKELKKIGCRFSLDDFGTGLSSFSYLKFLPVDYIKIDGSFIREINSSSADLGLVKTINEIAHYMGKETIAEHVENTQIINTLKELEIDFIQGSAVHDPEPLDQVLNAAKD